MNGNLSQLAAMQGAANNPYMNYSSQSAVEQRLYEQIQFAAAQRLLCDQGPLLRGDLASPDTDNRVLLLLGDD